MKKKLILAVAMLSIVISGCSMNQPNLSTNDKNLKLKNDRDYLAVVSKKNELHIVDSKTQKLYKTCKLAGEYSTAGLIMSPDGNTAYVLQDAWGAVYGYDMNTCQNTFSAKFYSENIKGRSVMSFNLSNDGKELYTISNPVKLLADRYEVMDPVFSIYDTSAGVDAKPVKSFEAPRQITMLSTAKDGSVYASGPNLYKIDPHAGKVEIAAELRKWKRENYSVPDILALWPVGKNSNEFLLMYIAAKFKDATHNADTADYVWGAVRTNLETNEVEISDFAPLETVMFTGMTHPKDSNLLYGVLTDLTKFDRKAQKVIKRVDLDHSYYCINFATDGSKIYLGAALNKIAIYDPDTLEKLNTIVLPDGDVGIGTLQVFRVK